MAEIPSVIQKHPVATGVAVLAGAIIVYMLFSSGASADTVSGTVPSTVSTGSDMVDANSLAITQGQQQLDALNIQAATQVQVAGLQAQVQSQQISAAQDIANKQTASTNLQSTLAAQVQNNTTQAALQAQLADFTTQQNITQINADLQNQIAQTNAQTAIALSYNNATLQTNIAMINADTQNRITQANVDIATANAQTAQYTAYEQTQVALANINATAATTQLSIKESNKSWWDSIF